MGDIQDSPLAFTSCFQAISTSYKPLLTYFQNPVTSRYFLLHTAHHMLIWQVPVSPQHLELLVGVQQIHIE